MGGRGSYSFSDRQVGEWSHGLGLPVPDTLKEAIGVKGEPNSIVESAIETNPYWSSRYREFSENCQRCVVAYELNRRGYNVTAQPTYRGDKLPKVAYYNQKRNTVEGRWEGAFKNAKAVDVSSSSADGVVSNIESSMRAYGSGSRGVVQIFYKSGGGHVFNVENQGGRIVYIEAQRGTFRNIKDTMASVDTKLVSIVRTDNLKISERAKNFVIKR